jgi:hypothetical protein
MADIFDYLTHLHEYVYNLKTEAESRARSILTAIALYVAAVTYISKNFADLDVHAGNGRHGVVIAGVIVTIIGTILAIVSTVLALAVFVPVVEDRESPMEPENIISLDLVDYVKKCRSMDENDVVRALAQEVRAVSVVQSRRSHLVTRAGKVFVSSFAILIVSLSLLGVASFVR